MREQVVGCVVIGALVATACGGSSRLRCGSGTREKDGECVASKATGGTGASGSGGATATGGAGGAAGTSPADCVLVPVLGERMVAFDSDRNGLHRDIYLMRADGTETWNLTQTPDIDETDPVFSPDGSTLFYVNGGDAIEAMDLETGTPSFVVTGTQPAISHDATEVAFHLGAAVFRTVLGDDSEPALVLSGPDELNGYAHPVYTPDDEHLVMDRGNQISLTGLDGSNERHPVMNWTTQIVTPDISPDGVFVVAAISCSSFPTLWVSALSESTVPCEGRPLETTVGATKPAWGPENLIAYVEETVPKRIGILSANTRETCSFKSSGNDDNPTWVPEGFVFPSWVD